VAASTYSAQNPSGSVPFDTGGAWVFYGERVVLFHKTIGLLSFAFFVVMNSAAAVFGPGYRLENSLTPDNLLHLLAATISIAIWLALRKRSLPARVVPGFDCLSTIRRGARSRCSSLTSSAWSAGKCRSWPASTWC